MAPVSSASISSSSGVDGTSKMNRTQERNRRSRKKKETSLPVQEDDDDYIDGDEEKKHDSSKSFDTEATTTDEEKSNRDETTMQQQEQQQNDSATGKTNDEENMPAVDYRLYEQPLKDDDENDPPSKLNKKRASPQRKQQQHLPRYNTTGHRLNEDGQPLLIMPPEDAVDEASFDDPYVYSDDSGSLSDAYFFPDHDSTNAVMSNEDLQKKHQQSSIPSSFLYWNNGSKQHQSQQPKVPSYGSTASTSGTTDPRTIPSRITLNGILEDSPLQENTPLVPNNHNTSSSKQYMHHRLTKKQLQQRRAQLIRRKQLQEQRERAVKKVRGKPQTPNVCHDVIWLLLFILQILFVVSCAIRYGSGLFRTPSVHPTTRDSESSTSSSSSSSLLNTKSQSVSLLQTTNTHSNNTLTNFPNARANDDHDQHLRRNLKSTGSTNITTSTATVKEDTPEDLKSLMDDDNFAPVDIKQPSSTNTKSKTASSTSSSSSSSSTATSAEAPKHNSGSGHSGGGNSDEEVPFSMDYQNITKLFWISGVYGLIVSYFSLGVMLIVARALIPLMLVFSILLAVCWGVFGLTIDPYSMISILGFVFLILSLGYALICWNRIGFCSTNLYTAICAMRDTPGVLFVGIGSLWIAVLWCWIWSVALMGILNAYNAADCEDDPQHCDTHVDMWKNTDLVFELIVLCLSFYWTLMVIKNVVRVTVAGAIGAWWFASPKFKGRCCCDNTVWGPWSRACSNSLGSICLGSLIVFPAQAISVVGNVCCWMFGVGGNSSSRENNLLLVPPGQQKGKQQQRQRAASSSSSTEVVTTSSDPYEDDDELVQECSGWIDRIWKQVRCCNRWAFTYIGMYGYSFSEGGEKAIQLFETREWMGILKINDLILIILLMASIVIGGFTGIFAVLVEEMDGYTFTSLNEPVMVSFWIGTILGFVLSNILLLGVVGAAVNAVLVCFAADPFEFDKNHPVLSREMREVWSQQVWEPSVDTV